MDPTLITAGMEAFNGLRTISAGPMAVRDLRALGALQIELQSKILDAQGAMMNMQLLLVAQREEVEALKRELADLKAQASDREKYALHELVPGSFVYKYTGPMDDKRPSHYLCQPCFDKDVKAVLRFQNTTLGNRQVCPVCKDEIYLGMA